jgi:SAM-dependent methyltransferase
MGVIRRTWDVWRGSVEVGAHQTQLDRCPCCFAERPEFLFDANDLSTYLFVDRRLKRGRYSLCGQCGTIFAALRPKPEVAETYYRLFPELEDKTHDIYPPPSRNSKGKLARANEILGIVGDKGLLKPDMAVLHIRADVGAALKLLRERFPAATLHGLEFFDNNIRYLREQGFQVEPLSAAGIVLPFGTKYDLIFANHILTHAFEPRADLARLRDALKPGGHILFYSEVDHSILFDPASPSFSRIDVINYHKQLLVPETLESLLRNAGFDCQFAGRQRFLMTYLAAPSDQAAPAPAATPAFLERQRQMVQRWQKTAVRYRYPIALAEAVRPLLHRRRPRKARETAAR